MTLASQPPGRPFNGLISGDAPCLRRWILAAAVVILVHAAIVFWLLYTRDLLARGTSGGDHDRAGAGRCRAAK